MIVACAYDLLKYILELKKSGANLQATSNQIALLA